MKKQYKLAITKVSMFRILIDEEALSDEELREFNRFFGQSYLDDEEDEDEMEDEREEAKASFLGYLSRNFERDFDAEGIPVIAVHPWKVESMKDDPRLKENGGWAYLAVVEQDDYEDEYELLE